MDDLTTEEIQKLRRLGSEAHDGPWSFWPDYGIRPAPKYGRGVQLSFDGQEEIDSNTALVIAMRNALPALLDMAERCAKAEAERNELALHVLRFSTKALKGGA